MGLLVITDAMINRVNENWRKGKRTHVSSMRSMSSLKTKKVHPSLPRHGDNSEKEMPTYRHYSKCEISFRI